MLKTYEVKILERNGTVTVRAYEVAGNHEPILNVTGFDIPEALAALAIRWAVKETNDEH